MENRCFFLQGCTVLLLGHAFQVWAQPSAAAPTPTVSANAVTQAAAVQGVQNCLGRIQQVSSALGFSAQSGALLMIPPSEPDTRIIPLAMEVPVEGGSAYVGIDFAPNQANGCGASYDAIVYWKQSCKTVAGKSFADLKEVGKLKDNITVLDGGLNIKVLLLPAGNGCVSIKKEVVL